METCFLDVILLSIDTVKSKKYVALKWENVHFIWKHIMSRYFQLLCFRCKKLFRRNICIKAFLECGAYQYKGREGSRILSKSKYAMICIFQFGNFMQKTILPRLHLCDKYIDFYPVFISCYWRWNVFIS